MTKLTEIRSHGPNQALIDYLEGLLENAKDGRVQSICGVIVFDSGSTSDMWVQAPDDYPIHLHSDRMIGCLERIKFQLIAHRHGVETEDRFRRSDT